MSFFEELKRRNVFRVGIAYAITVWVLIQALDIFLPTFGAPEWVMKVVSILLLAGLPVVLVFSWAFEMTPEGIKREKDVNRSQSLTPRTGRMLNSVIIGLMAIAIAFLLYENFYPSASSRATPKAQTIPDGSSTETATVSPQADRKSIAVLPFDNRSAKAEDEFFVEGIHDDLLTNLARIGSLKVISRTSVARYKDTAMSIPDIAIELGVATVMEGAVQRSGDKIRINVQLIDAQTDEHLWAEIFDREMTAENLFAIQSDISQKIAVALETTLSPQEQKRVSDRPTENLDAYEAYLRGRQQMARRTSDGAEQAALEFQRAVVLDPQFALAWAAIAENTRWLMSLSTMAIPEGVGLREDAANKALAINPHLGQAYIALAGNDIVNEEWDEAEAKFQKGIELNPGNAQAYLWYADFLGIFPGRLVESITMARQAEALDPLSPSIQVTIAEKLMLSGRFDEAEQQLLRTLQIDREYAQAYQEMADLMRMTGRFDQEVQWLRRSLDRDGGNIRLYVKLAFAYLNMDDRHALDQLLPRMQEINPQHWSVGWVESIGNYADGNASGALESGRWVDKQLGDLPNFQNYFGWVHILNGDFVQAREKFQIAHPEFFDRSTWRKGIEGLPGMGCFLSWVSQRAGAEDPMIELVDLQISYIQNELPLFVEHAHRYSFGECQMLKGDVEGVLDAMELSVDHGHHDQWWVLFATPFYDSLNGHPRFEVIRQQILTKAAEQRANLAQMELSGP